MLLEEISIEDILNAYANGLFPMAESAEDDETFWFDPPKRGQLSIPNLHIPKRLRTKILQFPFEVTINQAFEAVIDKCGEPAEDRPSTWINAEIKAMFMRLHKHGFAHSVECWDTDKKGNKELVGGVYGLAIGGLFCAESKFHRKTDASKIALVHLCARLHRGRFAILDAQFTNKHLEQFGIYEISKEKYLENVQKAIFLKTDFHQKNISEQDLITEYLNQNAEKM